MNAETRKEILTRANGRCEWCGCPVGKVLIVRLWGMYAEQLPEKSFCGMPFRRWRCRSGHPAAPPLEKAVREMTIRLVVHDNKVAICQRCASAAYRGAAGLNNLRVSRQSVP